MKRILPLLFAFFIFNTANSQVRIGLAFGAHQSTVTETNDLPNFEEIKSGYSGRFGIHFGFIADIPFSPASKLSFQPGIHLYNKGRKYADSVIISSSEYYSKTQQYINYIDIPLNIVYKFPLGKNSRFIIGGGPVVSFYYNGKEKSELFATGFYELEENKNLLIGNDPGKYRLFNYGVNALAGVEFRKMFITANYQKGLNDFYESADYDGSFKHQVIGATLGFWLNTAPLEVKPKDSDKDGVTDDLDACPTIAGSPAMMGCPDTDGDGLADKDDRCPGQAGPVSNNGCPVVDRDNDGVNDDKDKCPDTPGLQRYDGCPVPDTDNDGVNDDNDKCPQVPGYGRYDGCPIPDTDGDGVNDENDNCVNEKGTAENKGCPSISQTIIDKVEYAAQRIQFAFQKAELLPASLPVLNSVADILNADKNLRLNIEGHTSADGDAAANLRLSKARAQKVKDYLVSKGVEASRLTAEGFGSTQPLNDGRTSEEKAKNRRVELKLSN